MKHCWSKVVLVFFLTSAIAVPATLDSRVADEQLIQRILDDWVAAWNAHDMGRMASLYSEDADFVVITAQHLRGRKEIYAYHDALHKGLFKDSQRKARWTDLRFIRPDVCIGHVYFEPPDSNVKGRGERTALALVVLSKDNGKWWITSFQNTLKYGPPLPQQFPTD